jgi:hypothetical protein
MAGKDGRGLMASVSQKINSDFFCQRRLTLPVIRNNFHPSRSGKGRVASVFVVVERVAVAATMPDLVFGTG